MLTSVQLGQQIVKIINDEPVTLLGDTNAKLETGGNPTRIIRLAGMVRANHLQRQARQADQETGPPTTARRGGCVSAGGDGYETLATRLMYPCSRYGRKMCRRSPAPHGGSPRAACNVLIADTAGRLQIDETRQELVDLGLIKPQEIARVDAATGQKREVPRTSMGRWASLVPF